MIKTPISEAKYFISYPGPSGEEKDHFWMKQDGGWIHQSVLDEKKDKLPESEIPVKVTKEQAQQYKQKEPAIVAVAEDGKVLEEPVPIETKQSGTKSNRPNMKRSTRQTPDHLGGKAEEKPKGSWLRALRWPLYITAGFVMAFLLMRSHALYQTAFQKWGLEGIDSTCQTFNSIPLIGGWVTGGCVNIAQTMRGFLAFLALISLTILQALPTLAFFHPGTIRGMVDLMRWNKKQQQQMEKEQGDSQDVSRLVDRHNRLSEDTLRGLLILSVLAFAAEAYIIWYARSGKSDLTWVLIDALGFDLVLVGTLMIKNLFTGKPPRRVRRYEG